MWSIFKKKGPRQERNHMQELSEEIAICSGGLCSIFQNDYKLSKSELDFTILENYGFLLANIHFQGGLSNDEVRQCITLFSNRYGIHHFETLVQSATFYSNLFYEFSQPANHNNPLFISKFCYNLRRPRTWDNFRENIHIENIDIFKDMEAWEQISAFLKDIIPKRINPILEKL